MMAALLGVVAGWLAGFVAAIVFVLAAKTLGASDRWVEGFAIVPWAPLGAGVGLWLALRGAP